MAITRDPVTEAIRTGTGSPTTVSHTNASSSGVKGVLVFLMHGTSNTDHISAVTYGGTSLTRVARASCSTAEPGAAEVWFLGTNVAQGTQDCVYTSGATTDDIDCRIVTLLAGTDLQIASTDVSITTVGANCSVSLGNGARNGMAFAAGYSGVTAETSVSAGSNCSKLGSGELSGNFCSYVVCQTTGSASTPFTLAATIGSDDRAFAAVMVVEAGPIEPPVGAVAVLGYAPTLVIAVVRDIPVGTATLAGLEPMPSVHITTGVGALVVAGLAPTPSVHITTGVGAATIAGLAPTLGFGVAVPVGAVQVLTAGPSVFVETAVNTGGGSPAPLLALTLNLQVGPVTIGPPVGTATIDGLAPTLKIDHLDEPGTGAVVITGYAPLVTVVISIDAGAVAVAGYAPSFVAGQFMSPAQAELVIAGLAPDVFRTESVAPDVGTVLINGLAPVLDTGIPTGVGAIAVSGLAPAMDLALYPGTAALTIAGLAPVAIDSGATDTGGGGPGLLVALGLNLTPARAIPQADLTITGLAPSWGATYSFEIPQATLTVSGLAPNPQDSGGSLAPVMQNPPNLVFTGYPPQIYIGVQVRFPFTADAQGFVATPGAGTTMAWSGDGNPGGSLGSLTTGNSRNSLNVWTLATDWAALGIPANKLVTAISLASADSRVIQYILGGPSTLGPVTLTPTGGAPIQISAARTANAAEAGYTNVTGTGASGLELPSGGSLSITASNQLRTLAAGGSKTVNVRQDNVNFVVTYTSAKTAIPDPAALALTGYAPTVTSVAAVISQPPAGALAIAGAGPTVVVDVPPAGGGGGPGLLAGLALNLEGTPLGPANLVITGYAPVIVTPIVLQGSDELISEAATLTSAGGRVITGASHTIVPGVGALTATGETPTAVATATSLIDIPATALTITTTVPTLGVDHVRVMGVGAITVDGYGPSVEPSYTVSPLIGSLTIAGLEPIAIVSQVGLPDVGAITITGLAPSLQQDVAFSPGPAVLTITGYDNVPFSLKVWNGTGSPASRAATVSGSGFVKRIGSGVLASQRALELTGTGVRVVAGVGIIALRILQSGPASLSGQIQRVTSVVRSQPATMLARGRIRDFQPSGRRLKPERVNRWNVRLKNKPPRRIKVPRSKWVTPPAAPPLPLLITGTGNIVAQSAVMQGTAIHVVDRRFEPAAAAMAITGTVPSLVITVPDQIDLPVTAMAITGLVPVATVTNFARVQISDQYVWDVTPGFSVSKYNLRANGQIRIYRESYGGYTTIPGEWLLTGAATDYDFRFSHVSGAIPVMDTGPALGVWGNVATHIAGAEARLQNNSSYVISTILVEIRDKITLTVLDSATIILEVDGSAF